MIKKFVTFQSPGTFIAEETPEKVKEFHDGNSNIVPDLDSGHSGNTFGCACSLASLHLTNPDLVYRQHGALSPLIGSPEYGE